MQLAQRLLFILLLPACAHAQIVSDRPDAAEGSGVLGRGVVQIEAGLAAERNGAGERTTSTPTMLRFGLSDNVDLRLETDGRMGSPSGHGFADVTVGAKWRLQEGGKDSPALALIGQVGVPSGSRQFKGQGYRPSLLLATEWELSSDLTLAVMPGAVRDRDDNGAAFTAGILAVSLDQEWTEQLHSFIELSAPQIATARHGGTMATLNAGLTYALSKLWQIDTALFRGLNKRTPDLYWTVGLSHRF
jgi:hypothetical protein